jgi:AraC family transcriptional regulator of adaptative response/methylated-DNA-[protein]-cysteine methyltransferase
MKFMSSNPQIASIQTRDVLTMTPFANLRPAPVSALDPEAAWKQLAARDPQARFFYGVTTTGVFCRPSCPSRRPLRENVRFFRTVAEAQAAGFRPCQRCRPTTTAWGSPLDKVRGHIESNIDRPVRLEELGRVAGLSPFTVQRLFKREMGVSPLQYQRAMRAGRLRCALKQGESVTDAIYTAGFGSSSRAYEGNQMGMTPARFAQGGKGEQIGYASARTPFGWMIVGATERGLCWLSLAGTKTEGERILRDEFPSATLLGDPSVAEIVKVALENVLEPGDSRPARTPLDLRGTVFQLRVWQALRQIPRGETRSYSQLARELGDPKATRAVARACATNRVALLVPCHRVVGADGSLTGYRWGLERKRQLLKAESTASGSSSRRRARVDAERRDLSKVPATRR